MPTLALCCAAAGLVRCCGAEAYIGRGWGGDACMALRDCDAAATIDPACARAYLRRIHALHAMNQFQVSPAGRGRAGQSCKAGRGRAGMRP